MMKLKENKEIYQLNELEEHGQSDQILLQSDHFFLFAGNKPIIEGYIILAPNHCGQFDQPFHAFSDIPNDMLDEVAFLRHQEFLIFQSLLVFQLQLSVCA